jgi:hypothetical protein
VMAQLSEQEQRMWNTLARLAPGVVAKERADAWKAGWDAAKSERPAEHEHEMEDCRLICGEPWYELGY